MIISFQNILFLKEFLACSGCFGLPTEIKKESETSFCCIFCAWFFHKNIPYLILYQWLKFQCHTLFPSQDIKQNVLWSSYLNSWWRHKNYFGSSPQAMADREKRGESGNTKNWISRERKEIFRWNKNIFHSFWGTIIWWKIEISQKALSKTGSLI